MSISAGLGLGDYSLSVAAEASDDAGVARILPAGGTGAYHPCQETDDWRSGRALRSRLASSAPTVCADGRPEYPLDAATVRRLGAALVRALPHGTESPRLLVGRDTA